MKKYLLFIMLNILVHVFSSRNSDILDIDYIISCFNRSVNIMLALPSSILGNLFLSYCCSFYGPTLCNIRSYSLQKMYAAWPKAIRRIYRVLILSVITWLTG